MNKGKSYKGDLTRYVPLSMLTDFFEFGPETLPVFITQTEDNGDDTPDLFGDTKIPVTLVGTSYSANPLWHFEGFLKESLQADILNVADEGAGPFANMRNWLDSPAYRETKPSLVIWEIPERYIALSETIKTRQKKNR